MELHKKKYKVKDLTLFNSKGLLIKKLKIKNIENKDLRRFLKGYKVL